MAVTSFIHTKGIFTKVPEFTTVVRKGFEYGTWDDAFRLEEGQSGDYNLMYRPEKLARGINIGLDERSTVSVKLSSPTSVAEIRDYFEYIEYICNRMKTNSFESNGKKYSISQIDGLIEEEIEKSKEALLALNDNFQQDGLNCIYLIGVKHPIALTKEDLETIDGSLSKLADYLDDKQQDKAVYCGPILKQTMPKGVKSGGLFKRDDKKAAMRYIAEYIVNEGEDTIFPLVARVLSRKRDRVISHRVIFNKKDGERIVVRFDDFVKLIDKSRPYDIEHVIINLSVNQMEEILEKSDQ